MRGTSRLCLLFVTGLFSLFQASAGEPEAFATPTGATSPTDFLKRDWYAAQGVELPRIFGVGFNSISMERDIEVVGVEVSFLDLPPQDVSELAVFEVENRTTLSMARLDAWVLPFLDVYLMVGETRTNTSVAATFTVDRPGLPPEEVTVIKNDKVDGPLYGFGATAVYGGDAWFWMADANYSRSDLDSFEGAIDAWYLSTRLGWHTNRDRMQYRLWGGLAYLKSSRSLLLSVERPVIGKVLVEVTQEPTRPWNVAIGGSVSINNRWDLMLEYGTNFSDATLLVLSATLRFH